MPILGKTADENEAVNEAVAAAAQALRAAGVRVQVDGRDWLRPGAKFFEWERKGVPLRLEVGPRDVAGGVVQAKARPEGSAKRALTLDPPEALARACQAELDAVHARLWDAATARLGAGVRRVDAYQELVDALAQADAAAAGAAEGESGGGGAAAHLGFFLAPWRCNAANEEAIKQATRATVRCYPLEGQEEAQGKACFYSGEPATHMAIFARAF